MSRTAFRDRSADELRRLDANRFLAVVAKCELKVWTLGVGRLAAPGRMP
jgi:hypothetical protein